VTPNAELGSFPLGRGLAKVPRFLLPPLIPAGRAQDMPEGIASQFTSVSAFPPATVRQVLLGTLGRRAAWRHYAPKSNKGSSAGFKGCGTRGSG